MNRQPGSLLLLARLALGASVTTGLVCSACAGTGPAVVEHPRSHASVAVAPESDPLAGAPTFRLGESDAPPRAASSPAPERALALPARAYVPARTSPVVIYTGAWNLALGNAASEMTPERARSAAFALSAGAPLRLVEPPASTAILTVSEEAMEEGAWDASRR
jgi:hypothetical protein